MRSIIFIIMSINMIGCVTKNTAIRHGHVMYSRGYSVAMEEMSLQRTNIELANSYLREELRRLMRAQEPK